MPFDYGHMLQMVLGGVTVPSRHNKIYKDECVYSFDSPFSTTGLYVCMKTFYGVGKQHLRRHYLKTGSKVYLHLQYEKVKRPEVKEEKKPTKLAIGLEGGFDIDPFAKRFMLVKKMTVVILPHFAIIPWPNDFITEQMFAAVEAILDSDSVRQITELEQQSTWDGELRCVSKYAKGLMQLNEGKKVPASGWKCEECDLKEHLWMNLTDGSILCGRKYFDGTGGNNHAVEHFKKTGFPLAVKLGTVTKEGTGDVYSYAEDDMVDDPYLKEHLAHFGINMDAMEKSEKTMIELELDLNQKFGEWAAIQEAGLNLKPLYGAGYTGMKNLGNSCYLNSVMQVIFTIPCFIEKYFYGAETIFRNAIKSPVDDFETQMAKLGTGLLSGKYSRPPKNEADLNSYCVTPFMFKTVIGKGHQSFSTKQQQDAQEFFLHFLSCVQEACRNQYDLASIFEVEIEDRFQCTSSGKVKYTRRKEYCLPLSIPLYEAINNDEVEEYKRRLEESKKDPNSKVNVEVVRPRIPLMACMNALSQLEQVEEFYSSAIKGKTIANKTTRLASCPKYLVLHLKRYALKDNWTPMKLDVEVIMPDILDVSSLLGVGFQPGEELLPEEEDEQNEERIGMLLPSLLDMGFPIATCQRALRSTNTNCLETITNWIMEHMDDSVMDSTSQELDPSFNFTPDENAVASIMSLGFTLEQATMALRATGNNVERAVDWVLSHPDGDIATILSESAANVPEQMEVDAKPPENEKTSYRLKAFVSHMGTSTTVGHYVCHVFREGKWIIFNDEKVALSEKPPKNLGYLYLYEQT